MTKNTQPLPDASTGELKRARALKHNTIVEQERTIADLRAQILRLESRLAARRNLATHRKSVV